MKNELFQRVGGKFYSRDYYYHIKCARTECPANRNQACSMPSAIEINANGNCKTGSDLINLSKELNEKNKIERKEHWKYNDD